MQAVDEKTLLEDSDAADARIEAAMQSAVRHALRQHKQRGNTVVVWRDGHMVLLPSEEINVPDNDDDLIKPEAES